MCGPFLVPGASFSNGLESSYSEATVQSGLVLRFFRRRFPILILALAPFVHAPSAHAKCLQLGLVYQGTLAPDTAQLVNHCINRVGYVYCILNGSNPPRPFYCADAKFGAGFVPAGGADVISVAGASGPAKVRWYECEAQKPDDYPIPVNPRFDMIEVNADCPRSKDDSSNPFAQGNSTGSSANPFTPDKSKNSSDNPFAPGAGKTAQSQTVGRGTSNAKGATSSLGAKSNGTNASNGSSAKASIPPSSQYSGSFSMTHSQTQSGSDANMMCQGTFTLSIDNFSGSVSGNAEITNPTSPYDPNGNGPCPTAPQHYFWRSTPLNGSVTTTPDGRGGFTQTINGSLASLVGNDPNDPNERQSFGNNGCSWTGTFVFSPPSSLRGNGTLSCDRFGWGNGLISGSWSTN